MMTFDVIPSARPLTVIHKHLHGQVATVRGKYRCTHCGHRLTVNGIAPRTTRSMPVRTWYREIIDRYRAKSTHRVLS